MKKLTEHLLREGSHFITICGIDTEYKDGVIAYYEMNDNVNCMRCLDSLILERQRARKAYADWIGKELGRC